MTLGTILYIFLFFVSVFISIMYLEFGAMALMGLMVTIPVCMFLFCLFCRRESACQSIQKIRWQKKMPLISRREQPYAVGRKQKPSASGDERNCQGSL